MKLRFLSGHQLEKILGKLLFASIVDPIRRAFLKSLNWFLRPFARKNFRNALLKLPQALKLMLICWLKPGVLSSSLPFGPPLVSLEVFTDASRSGWGVCDSRGHKLAGRWYDFLQLSHKYSRTYNNLPFFAPVADSGRHTSPSALEQYDSGQLSEQDGFSLINTAQQLGVEHPSSAPQEGAILDRLSYRWGVE